MIGGSALTAVAVAAATTLAIPAPASAADSPRPPEVSVKAGTYFSKTYDVRISGLNDAWDTKKVILRGGGSAKTLGPRQNKVALSPGRYRIKRVYHRESPPEQRMRGIPRGWTRQYVGQVLVIQYRESSQQVWDPTADVGKGYSYQNEWDDYWADKARKDGATYVGKVDCLAVNWRTGASGYWRREGWNDVFVEVPDGDSRAWELPLAPWVALDVWGFPDGQRRWVKLFSDGRPCRRAFHIGQTPADYFVNVETQFPQSTHVLALPDGNIVDKSIQEPDSFQWQGYVEVVSPSGAVYRGDAVGDPAETEGNARPLQASQIRFKLVSAPPTDRSTRTVTKAFTVRAVNGKWASQAEVKAIRMGMPLSQVARIIGSPGSLEVRGSALQVRQYHDKWGDLMLTIGFRGGRVASLVY